MQSKFVQTPGFRWAVRLCALTAALASHKADAMDFESTALSLGAAAWPKPALSVRYKTLPMTAWHVTTRYGDQGAGFTADYQKGFRPGFGSIPGYELSFYTGMGLQGESSADQASEETYHLRFPGGLQWDLEDLHLQAFAEACALIGELPSTRLGGTYSGGLRASF